MLKKYTNAEQMVEDLSINIKKTAFDEIEKKGVFTIALSGGKSPVKLYEKLAEIDFPWEKTVVFLVDERYISSNNSESNQKLIKDIILDKLKIKPRFIFPNTSLEYKECIENYKNSIIEFFKNQKPVFDLTLLGIGSDGHTASIFPKTILENSIISPSRAPENSAVTKRITFTFDLINNSKNKWFVTAGKERKEVINKVINKDKKYPASFIDNTVIYYLY